jgi:hypothetical protein
VAPLIDRILALFRPSQKEPRLFDRSFAPADHPLRPTLDQRYLDMRAAMASGNANNIAALLAPGFASVDIRGNETTAQQMIDSVLKLDIDRSKRQVATTLSSVETHHDIARVLQHYSMTSSPDAPKSMPRKLQTFSADTWRLIDGAWLLSKTRTLEVQVLDGFGRQRYAKGRGIVPLARYPLFVTARIWEYIEPIARGDRYEDPLESFLERNDLGEIDGGGTQIGEVPKIEFVDVTFWLRDSDEAISAVAQEFDRLGAPVGSQLQFERGGQEVTVPFGSTECVAVFLDGVSLPREVYKETGADDIRQRLEAVLEGLGEFRSYWHGNRESALFFNGQNAEQMVKAMMPVLTREPLCQNARLIVRYGRHPAGAQESRLPLLG